MKKEAIGVCHYCGQSRIVTPSMAEILDDSFTQEYLDELATSECDCKEGQMARERAERLERGREIIQSLVPEREGIVEDILLHALDGLVDKEYKSLSIKLGERISYKMFSGKEDNIVVQRQETVISDAEID